jgi:uncharacterized protein (DUF433 family)
MSPLQLARRIETSIDDPAYTPNVAARHLKLPVSTVRWWTLGNGQHSPLIRIAGPDVQLLSFRNVVEAHVLSAVMCQDRDHAPLAIVRTALATLEERIGRHPLSSAQMEAGGGDLFVSRFAALTNASRQEEASIRFVLAAYLQRIRRDAAGQPCRLLLFTRGHADGPEHVMMDPAVLAGQPCIAGTAVPTTSIAERFAQGESLMQLARTIGVSVAEVEEALRYESCRPL